MSASGDRPDPSEPWRYECPSCGSVQVYRFRDDQRPAGKTYPFSGTGQSEARRDRSLRFRCRECGDHLRTVYDRANDTEVARV